MSKYTMELRYILEIGYDFGLNDYPIFNESYRKTLNDNIINSYYFSEICEETVARWAIRFKVAYKILHTAFFHTSNALLAIISVGKGSDINCIISSASSVHLS